MADRSITWSVFTKPWKVPADELAGHVKELGFDAVEYPVRPGFEVSPENVGRELARVAKVFSDHGLQIASIAGPTDERTIAACAQAGVPVIRVMAEIGRDGYLATVARLQKEYDALVPLLEKHGVRLGVQNHCGAWVSNASGLLHLIGKYDPRHLAAVWDAAHNAIAGEEPELAIDIIWSRLCMVNLKNAFWQRKTGPEAPYVEWETYWTSGRQGLASWPRVATELKRRSYAGVICITAEYSDAKSVDRLVAEDLAFAKSLFA
ncbi:MAG: TIM barrel protein [Planctomycetota bacterium]